MIALNVIKFESHGERSEDMKFEEDVLDDMNEKFEQHIRRSGLSEEDNLGSEDFDFDLYENIVSNED